MKKLFFLLVFFILIIFFISYSFLLIYLPLNFPSGEKIVEIEKGRGSREIADFLEKEGVIRSKFFFLLYLFLTRKSSDLKPGFYSFKSPINILQVVEKLVKGDIIKERFTIIEGWNLRDIGLYFEDKGISPAEKFWALAGSPALNPLENNFVPLIDFSKEYEFLADKPKNVGLEGYLFPDTYEFIKGEALENIVRKMLNNFDRKLKPEIREEIQRQGKSIYSVVIMASLLEKEVRTLEDKKIVSGILWKRLENNMPLQVDATITYLTGKKTTRISVEETQIDSPYNTYKHKGLPVAPISNPGLQSILAAVYPQESPYWYYLSTPEGETIFSTTLKEHNIAKAKYLY
jgi:UPF0755 protein